MARGAAGRHVRAQLACHTSAVPAHHLHIVVVVIVVAVDV